METIEKVVEKTVRDCMAVWTATEFSRKSGGWAWTGVLGSIRSEATLVVG